MVNIKEIHKELLGEMAYWVKMPATKPCDLSSTRRNYLVGENPLLNV